MFIYILILSYFIILFYQYDLRNIKPNKITYISIFSLLVCLAGFRYYIGVDTYQYRFYYEDVKPIFQLSQKDIDICRYNIGWIIYNSICKSITSHFELVQFINAILLNYGVLKNVKKYASHPILTIIIYYFGIFYLHINFEYMREAIAVSLFLIFGVDFIAKKQYFKYIILIFICYNFHSASIIMLIFPAFYVFKLTRRNVFIFIIIILLLQISPYLFINLVNIDYIKNYATSSLSTTYIDKNIKYYLFQLYPLWCFLILYLVARKFVKIKLKFIPFIIYSIGFYTLSTINYTATRFVDFTFIFLLINVSNILMSLIKEFRLPILIITSYLILFNINIAFQYNGKRSCIYFPYVSCFEERTPEQRYFYKTEGIYHRNAAYKFK